MKLRTFDPREAERMEAMAGKPLASFSSRAAALAVDLICGTGAAFAVILLMAAADFLILHGGRAGEGFGETLIRTMTDTGFAKETSPGNVIVAFDPHGSVLMGALMGVYIALATYFGNGKTPGKKVMGIRVLSLSHGHITMWQAIERTLGYTVSMAEAGFGFLQYFIHPNRRTVHDRIAETIVVKDR